MENAKRVNERTAQSAPTALPVSTKTIPEELRFQQKWVCWRYVLVDGHWAKVPFTPLTGRAASTTNPETWGSFKDATTAMSSYDGVGYVIEARSGIVGIDFDDCRDPATGEIASSVREHLAKIKSYAEISPSGTGVKLLTRSDLLGSYVDHYMGVEVYSGKRYFAITGEVIEGHETLPPDAIDLDWFISEVLKQRLNQGVEQEDLLGIKLPLSGWTLKRVRDELLPHFSSEGYHDWLQVGMALHHQGRGGSEWLELWDCWSKSGTTYAPSVCAGKWKGFHEQKPGPHGVVTLATLIQKVQLLKAEDPKCPLLDPKDPIRTAREFCTRAFTTDGQITLIRANNLWYHHTGPHYQERDHEALRGELWKFLEGCIKHDKDGRADSFKPNKKQIDEVVDALKAITLVERILPPAWLPSSINDLIYPPKEIVSLSNGFLHLPTRTLLPHTPDFFSVNSLPYPYDRNASPHYWLEFLDQIWADDSESKETLQEIFGYLLTTDTSQQKIFLLVGPKRSGKGTIGRVLKELVGTENYAAPTLSSLASNFGLQPLIGKLVALIPDARLGANANVVQAGVERLLMVSGEDAITIDRKHQMAWTGTLSARFIILSNEVPQLSDASGALHSRFITLALQESFLGREDRGLTPRLLNELTSIFRWALDGWDRLHERGHFIQPRSGQYIAEELRELSSPISTFLHDKCDIGLGYTVPTSDIYEAWKTWCYGNGTTHPCNAQTFGKQLHAAVPGLHVTRPRDKDGHPIRLYQGVRLKPGIRRDGFQPG